MVVRVPDSFGDLISKGNVKIPCQCYYSARDNILTEILQHSYSQVHNSENTANKNKTKHDFEKVISKNGSEMKNAETETLPEPCCVCEYFRNLEKSKHKKDLWNMQFNRWWGWNWQRKRKSFLSKFKTKGEKDCTCPTSSKHETSNLNNDICYCHTSCRNIQQEVSYNNKIKSHISQNKPSPSNIPELAEPMHPTPPITTYNFKKHYTGRRKRNKNKHRLYEGWVREITSSESDNSVKSVKIRMTSPKIASNNKDYMKYLSFRIRKLNSDESVDEDKQIDDEGDKVESDTKLEEKTNACLENSKYYSPISGKYYDLHLPEFSNPFTEINDTEYLKPIDIKDEQIIPNHEYSWMKYYSLMKREHSELLKSISNVLYKTKMREHTGKEENVQSEKEIRNFNYTSKTKSISKDICNKNSVEKQENILENKVEETKQNYEIQKPSFNFEHKSEYIISPTNPFYECSLVKSLIDNTNYCSKPISLPNYKPVQPLFISKSSNLFYQDAIENHFKNEEQIEEKTEHSNTKKLNYDINYISNNLQSFSSSISDTDFLNSRTEISNLKVTEDMSERFIREIDLFK